MSRAAVLLLMLLAGCDKLTGAADQKIADAEAVGFACRVSLKAPEACMKENDAQSPSSILDGWKAADEDIKAGKLDPAMGSPSSGKAKDAMMPNAEKPAEDKPAEVKPAEDKAGDAPKEDKVKH